MGIFRWYPALTGHRAFSSAAARRRGLWSGEQLDPDDDLGGQRDREDQREDGMARLVVQSEHPDPATDRATGDREAVQAVLGEAPAVPARLRFVDGIGSKRGDRPCAEPRDVRLDPADRDEGREADERGGHEDRERCAVARSGGQRKRMLSITRFASGHRSSSELPSLAWIVMMSGPS